VFATARHWSLSWARFIQSTPSHTTSVRSILTLSSHLLLGLPSVRCPSGFLTKVLYAFLTSPIRATCHTNLILLYLITLIISSERTNYEVPHYAVSYSHPPPYGHFLPLRSKHSPILHCASYSHVLSPSRKCVCLNVKISSCWIPLRTPWPRIFDCF